MICRKGGPPALGSITSLADISGSLTDTYTTDSFGKSTASTGTTRNPFRYTARDLDSETGLMYYRARYYDPSSGRFISEDPIRFRGGANFYGYVTNNPVGFIDPSGFQGYGGLPVKPSEIISDFFHAGLYDTYKAGKLGQQTLKDALDSGLPGINNGMADAWRHCVLSCRLSRQINPEDARQILEQHEASGGGPANQNAMDQHNNEVGLKCALSSPNGCEKACYNSLYGNELQWIEGPKMIGPPVPKP